MAEQSHPALTFRSLNPTAPRTLLLLPGMFSSHHEFHLLLSTPHLQAYNLLLPDLPRHGLSADLNVPFTLPSIAALLADLIANHARNCKADVFGGDLGGYAALYLSAKYPERVSYCEGAFGTVNITGNISLFEKPTALKALPQRSRNILPPPIILI